MTFQDAVRTVLTEKYAAFNGRARRSEYWYFFLFNFILSIVASVIDRVIGFPALQVIIALGLLVPGIAVGVRRLHDIDKSGWFLLLGLIPLVGAILLIVWFCSDSKPDNQYGPNPKAATGGYGAQPGYGTPSY